MRIALYTKTVLTIIAIMVTVIAANQLFNPPVASAEGSFAGVQYTNGDGTTVSKLRLTKPGQPLVREK